MALPLDKLAFTDRPAMVLLGAPGERARRVEQRRSISVVVHGPTEVG